MQIFRTNSTHKDFIFLVEKLNLDLAIRDGEDHLFYHQFNAIDKLKNAVILKVDGLPVACGAFKEFDCTSVEIKRMYTLPSYRGKGLASKCLEELEIWAKELGYLNSLLETGKRQPEALKLYHKKGYKVISNFGPYKGVENSVCFQKKL